MIEMALVVGLVIGAGGAWLWVTGRVMDAIGRPRIRAATDGELELVAAVLKALLPDWFWGVLERAGRR